MAISTDTMAEQALAVAHALLDPERVAAALTHQAAATLSDGLAGTALVHACLARTASEFATAAAQHWEAAARLRGDAPPSGIHTGPGALAASVIIGSGYLPDPGPYREAARRATAWLSARAAGLARHQRRRNDNGEPGAPWAVYDAISGLAGIGRLLLAAYATGHRDDAEPGLTVALTTLTTLITSRDGARPGWWLPAADHSPSVTAHASGAATTGMAHGIAGPLALLSLAHTAGRTVTGQAEAIRTAASWLLTWEGPVSSWSPAISGDDLDTPPARVTRATRERRGRHDAWCYGAPGIGRALVLAGEALADHVLRRTGHAAIAAMGERDTVPWDTEGPGICHGSAGVLQAAAVTGCGVVARQAAEQTAACYDHRRPFGFAQRDAGATFDNPGFLTGAAGAALALADHTGLLPTDAPVSWDCLLLLS